jgi:hypothetical protein
MYGDSYAIYIQRNCGIDQRSILPKYAHGQNVYTRFFVCRKTLKEEHLKMIQIFLCTGIVMLSIYKGKIFESSSNALLSESSGKQRIFLLLIVT